MKRLIVQKRGTDDTSEITESYVQETEYTESYDRDNDETQEGGGVKYQSITRSEYQKPARGSRQDNFTKEDIKEKLVGFIPLRTMSEKKALNQMPLFKTWVRYINNETKQFRTGGLLMKVEYPKYIMLVNTAKNLTWSVQLEDNIIFVRDPRESDAQNQEKENVKAMKDKLYEMYKRGELRKK